MKFVFHCIIGAVTILFSPPLAQAASLRNLEGENCCSNWECEDWEVCVDACCWCSDNPTAGTCKGHPGPPGCFSSDATVQVLDIGEVAMKDLAIGDQVVTGVGYEPVYAFGHRNPTKKYEFLKIGTSVTGAIELSPDHFVKVNGRFVKASSVRAGDVLQGQHNVPIKVEKVESIKRDGVYAPLTPSGTILVDGIVASSYVSLQPAGDEFPVLSNGEVLSISQQFGIHVFLAPFRMLCMGVSSDFCDIKNDDGVAFWVDWGMRLAAFADKQNLFFQVILLVLTLALVLPFYAVEGLVGATFAPVLAVIFAGVWAEKATGMLTFSVKKGKVP